MCKVAGGLVARKLYPTGWWGGVATVGDKAGGAHSYVGESVVPSSTSKAAP